MLNVLRLAWDWNQSDTWQIDQGQIWASVRVYVEHNWVINDVGVCACYFVGQLNDSVSDLLEVGELLAFQLLRELSPWLRSLRLMVETKLERTSRHQTVTSW